MVACLWSGAMYHDDPATPEYIAPAQVKTSDKNKPFFLVFYWTIFVWAKGEWSLARHGCLPLVRSNVPWRSGDSWAYRTCTGNNKQLNMFLINTVLINRPVFYWHGLIIKSKIDVKKKTFLRLMFKSFTLSMRDTKNTLDCIVAGSRLWLCKINVSKKLQKDLRICLYVSSSIIS